MRVFTCLDPKCSLVGYLSGEAIKKHLAEIHQIDPGVRVPREMCTHVDFDTKSSTTYKYYFGKVEVLEYVEEKKEKK